MPKKRSSSTNSGPLILIGAGILLIVVFALYQVFTSNPASPSTSTSANPNLPFSSIERVKLADAKTALDQKSAIFVDVRDADVYKASHISDAINIPLGETQARLRELDPNKWIILYCTWPNEESSARAAQILVDNGYKHVSALLGGFNAWLQAKYPVAP